MIKVGKPEKNELDSWSPTGKPVVPNRRLCGATSRPHDGTFIHGQGRACTPKCVSVRRRGLLLVGIQFRITKYCSIIVHF